MKGKRAFQVDNFVILEETYSHEERKAKQAAKKAVQHQPAKRPNFYADVFKAVSKRAVKKLKYNSNPGSYNSIESEPDPLEEVEEKLHQDQRQQRVLQKDQLLSHKQQQQQSATKTPIVNHRNLATPMPYATAASIYPQVDCTQGYYYLGADPRYCVPPTASSPCLQQYVQQYTQPFNVMTTPSSYVIAPFAYYSMPQPKPAVQEYKPYMFPQVS